MKERRERRVLMLKVMLMSEFEKKKGKRKSVLLPLSFNFLRVFPL